ncbi:fibroblast growth factor receptor 1-like isoform X2 [Montipora foliosa]|uniref:fibroblast growth factor receptor 1-like isoform X2 n=1 Tax=Montipora foliosa TaxID=591990 RepID=UPI0035F12293
MIQGVLRYINVTCSLLIPLFFFDFLHGLKISSQPNDTNVAFIGSNVTLTWNLILTAEEKKEDLEVWFGTWNKNYHFIDLFLKKFTLNSSGTTNDQTANSSLAWRWFWAGDISRDYTVAYQLTNVQPSDAGDYGIQVRVDLFPPPTEELGPFSLVVKDPPPTPTPDPRNITMEVVEGDNVNITCRLVFDGTPVVIWLKDNIPLLTVRGVVLVIESVKRSQSGNYACFSVSHDENKTSAITAVNVLYAPSIHVSNKTEKIISLTVKNGTKIRLRCEADGNPKPQFVWRKNSDLISSGFYSSGNWSILTLYNAGEEEIAHFACTAKNKIGWDALTFNVRREKEPSTKQYTEPYTEAETVPQPLPGTNKATNADNEKSQVLLYASVSGAVVLIAFFVLVMTLIHRRRSNNRRKNDSPDRANTHPIIQQVINPIFSGDLGWEIPRENLNIEKVIGRGAFGVVSRALAWDIAGKSGWTVVAVKSVQEDASQREKRDLLSELVLLKNLDPHPHVIQLYGCVSTEDRPLVVVEYAQYGDLLGYLRRSRGVQDNYYSDPSVKPGSTLTSRQLLKFAWEISDGMHYVSMKKIIHRDLAARNVLVGEDEVCKITDFGMARDVQEDDIYVRTHEGRLPIKWTAPEALFGSGAYTTSSDVWSYGVVLYEIFTVGGDPFPGVLMRDIPTLLENGYRMSRPKYINSQLYETMTACWENDPSKRPDFGSLKATFHKLMEEEEQEYVNLEELFYENVLPSSC